MKRIRLLEVSKDKIDLEECTVKNTICAVLSFLFIVSAVFGTAEGIWMRMFIAGRGRRGNFTTDFQTFYGVSNRVDSPWEGAKLLFFDISRV